MRGEIPSLAVASGAAEDADGDRIMPAAGGSAEGAGEGETMPAASSRAEDAGRDLNMPLPASADPQQGSPPRLSPPKPGPSRRSSGPRLEATGTPGLRPEAECSRPPTAVVRPMRWRPSFRATRRGPPHPGPASGGSSTPTRQSSPHATQCMYELFRINVRLTQKLQSYRRFMSRKENLLSLIRQLDARAAQIQMRQ